MASPRPGEDGRINRDQYISYIRRVREFPQVFAVVKLENSRGRDVAGEIGGVWLVGCL